MTSWRCAAAPCSGALQFNACMYRWPEDLYMLTGPHLLHMQAAIAANDPLEKFCGEKCGAL